MKHITISDYQDNKSRAVTDEAADRIRQIIDDTIICSKCSASYSTANPQVLRNTCLTCFISDNKDKRYLCSKITECGYPRAERAEYQFIDSIGKIHVSNDTNDSPYYSMENTLIYHHFPSLPLQMHIEAHNGANKSKYINEWYFIGDLATSKYIFASASVEYWDKDYKNQYIRLEYVLEKGGGLYKMNNRKKATRELLAEAEKNCQAKNQLYSVYDIRIELLKLLNNSTHSIKN